MTNVDTQDHAAAARSKPEKSVAAPTPPANTAAAVRKHRRELEVSRDELKAARAGLALASARGEPGAQDAVAALRREIGDLEFEIECNGPAYELAEQQDVAAFTEWRAEVQRMAPDEIIEGIAKERCCHRCLKGINGGCVILAGATYAGPVCGHPIIEKHLFSRNDAGLRVFPYRDIPQVSKIFDAACEKLNVRKEFE